jgi:hypothetical protein
MISQATDSPPPGKWANAMLIVIFFVLIWLPTLDKFFHLDHTPPPSENRLPAPSPKMSSLSFAGAQTFIAGLEAYFNDHFGFRNALVSGFQQWKLALFHDHSVYKVVIGQDQWLFWGDSQMVEHYLGLEKFSPEQLAAWQRLLEKRRDWLARRGIRYLFVITPDKQDVYSEELPPWLIKATPSDRETKLDQFLKYMKAHSTVPILDFRQPLIEAKKIQPTYLQNDTHWNSFGAFVAGQTLLGTLPAQISALPPVPSGDFIRTNAPGGRFDLARMLGVDPVERNFYVFKPDLALPQLARHEDSNYPTAWGPKDVITLNNPLSCSNSITLFVDSYGIYWEQFLGYSFKTTTFLQDNRGFDTNLIIKTRPQIVVNEMLERYFNTEDTRQMAAKDGLP